VQVSDLNVSCVAQIFAITHEALNASVRRGVAWRCNLSLREPSQCRPRAGDRPSVRRTVFSGSEAVRTHGSVGFELANLKRNSRGYMFGRVGRTRFVSGNALANAAGRDKPLPHGNVHSDASRRGRLVWWGRVFRSWIPDNSTNLRFSACTSTRF
jgi:hypothetical protein